MAKERLRGEYESSKSRRVLRQGRQNGKRRGIFGGLFTRRRASRPSEVLEESLFWEDGAPKSRRALRRERGRRKRQGDFSELLVTLGVALILVFGVVRPFVVEAFRIPTESMVPTLEVGDRVFVNKFVYRYFEPERGDIVVFDSLAGDGQTLIKRVVGLPGDTVEVQDNLLLVNGEPQEEPYLNEEFPSVGSYGPTEVPQGHVFVMGDNRGNSGDSRVFGPVPLDYVKGEAFLRFWPVYKIEPILDD